MLKGLTVWYLLHKTFKVEPGHRVLIDAAAGGIGLLACQWAKALGAHVMVPWARRRKPTLALSNGCDHVILYNEEDFVARVNRSACTVLPMSFYMTASVRPRSRARCRACGPAACS